MVTSVRLFHLRENEESGLHPGSRRVLDRDLKSEGDVLFNVAMTRIT